MWYVTIHLKGIPGTFFPFLGCVVTLSSYNHFHRNCQKDAVMIAIANSLTSLFSGCVVFAILGYMAHDSDKSVMSVVKGGPGLAFLVYPEVSFIYMYVVPSFF